MSENMQARFRAGVVIVAPVVVLVGFIWAPYITDFTDNAAVADEIAADTARWSWATIIGAVGLALTVLLVASVRSYLREAGEQKWSFIAATLVTIGAVLLAFLTGSDFAMAAAIEGGASGEAVLEAREAWFVPILVVTGVIFGLGWLSLAAAIRASHILDAQQTWIVVGALVVLTIALFIPMSGGQYLLALSAIVASWLIGYHMWNDANPVTTTQPSPA